MKFPGRMASSDSIIDDLSSNKKQLDCYDFDKNTKFEVIGSIDCPTNDCEITSDEDATLEVEIWNKRDYPQFLFIDINNSSDTNLPTSEKSCEHIGAGNTREFTFTVEHDTNNTPVTETLAVNLEYVDKQDNCNNDNKHRSPNFDVYPKLDLC